MPPEVASEPETVSAPSPETEEQIRQHIEKRRTQCIGAYRADPLLVKEHASIERSTAQGGYGRRQIYELVQNGADAILGTEGTRIVVLLTKEALYCANEGAPINTHGIDSILHSSMSAKRSSEIGRFGLGFKSVLGVTSRPQFLSRVASFGFDEMLARTEILKVVPDAHETPVLRLAFSLNVNDECEKDSNLARFMEWATSVVRLPLLPDALAPLQEDIQSFPAEFLLFCNHVQILELEDRVGGCTREIDIASFANDLVLEETNPGQKLAKKSRWRIFSRQHRPSPVAKKDAGELSGREIVPITWAVPLEGRPGTGHFWAFFPTEYETTLSGILNAPWKTNEDRQNLLRGEFNNELLTSAAELVIESLQELTPANQPGAVLDYLPSRLKEEKQWADTLINEKVYLLAAQSRCLPDQDGILRALDCLKVAPPDLPDEALKLWADQAQRPVDWCHYSCDTRERRSRVDRLLAGAAVSRRGLREWLEAIAVVSTTASGTACQIAAILKESKYPSAGEILQSAIVLADDGHYVRPLPGKIFLPGITPAEGTAVAFVHPTLNNFVPFRKALLALGVTALNATEQLGTFLKTHQALTDTDLRVFWDLASVLPVSDVLTVLRTSQIRPTALRVNTFSRSMKRLDEVLLPGEIAGAGIENPKCTIDSGNFASLELLHALGAREIPDADRPISDEPWFNEYKKEALAAYFESMAGSQSRPSGAYLVFSESSGVGPLASLTCLRPDSAARFTNLVLGHSLPDWTLKHSSRERAYPVVSVVNPALWFVRKHGALATSLGVKRLQDCVGPDLRRFSTLLPVATCSAQIAACLQLAETESEISPRTWTEGLERCLASQNDDELGTFYSAAAQYCERPPAKIRCRDKDGFVSLPPSEAVVTRDRRSFEDLWTHGIPVVLAPDGWDLLISRWQLKRPEEALKRAIHPVPQGPPQLIRDRYPLLRLWAEDKIQHLMLQVCDSLRLEVFQSSGRSESEPQFYFDGETCFLAADLAPRDILRQISSALDLRLSESNIDNLIEVERGEKRDQRKIEVLSAPTPAERFVKAVGTTAIKSKLPTSLLNTIEAEWGRALDDSELYRLAEAVYGIELLRTFRDELQIAGLDPPTQWAGSFRARRFVRDLGFARAYAGFESANREPLVCVNGPPELPELHDFQRKITDAVRMLLRRLGGMRGLLSLPTGAGKTRVAVQAVVEEIRHEDFASPILWIAQSDELCEQAVQTWGDVWRSVGSRSVLSISRLWSSNEAEPVEAGPHVVVATVDKLRGCVDDAQYDWLSRASCVVVDEAHTSIAPEYTFVLQWLGLTHRHDRCPLLGLTATPFRGRSLDETERLVGRYGRRRLDSDTLGDDPYRLLQEMGVLAKVRHQLLDGIAVELSPEELSQLRTLRAIPSSVRERIGANIGRNQQLLKSIESLPADWPILLFASSVSHAQTMAALLNLAGIPSAAISSETDATVRRYYIDQFRRRRLRVLANYGVLTQGFDAPAVRAIYVARPTYSPNEYQQMIGRGLRGPMNGGKSECLIINVADNLMQYGESLAFTQFEFLWAGDASTGQTVATNMPEPLGQS
jgi:superfamily II DNA or RNA helicase